MREAHAPASWSLSEAVLRTVLYADVFDFPLTAAEIHRFLVGHACEVAAVERVLQAGALPPGIEADPPYYFLEGKGYSARVRRHYLPELERKWARARRYTRL